MFISSSRFFSTFFFSLYYFRQISLDFGKTKC
nr:MAG TPA: hypothetical protein [Caudoviricetes sp.]